MNTNTPEEQLVAYWLMPESELTRHVEIVGKILELRAQIRSAVPFTPLPAALHAARHTPTIKTLAARAPMRAPTPGSLRSIIQNVLEEGGGPMTRADIILGVAQKRGVEADEVLKSKVGEALLNKHDPFFIKEERGIYTLNKEVLHGT